MTDHDLFTYPLSAGFKERTTSRDAAKAIEARGRARNLRARILALYASGRHLTADECAAVLNESVLATRPRITELQQLGLIEKAGERRPSSTGTSSHVWRARR